MLSHLQFRCNDATQFFSFHSSYNSFKTLCVSCFSDLLSLPKITEIAILLQSKPTKSRLVLLWCTKSNKTGGCNLLSVTFSIIVRRVVISVIEQGCENNAIHSSQFPSHSHHRYVGLFVILYHFGSIHLLLEQAQNQF